VRTTSNGEAECKIDSITKGPDKGNGSNKAGLTCFGSIGGVANAMTTATMKVRPARMIAKCK